MPELDVNDESGEVDVEEEYDDKCAVVNAELDKKEERRSSASEELDSILASPCCPLIIEMFSARSRPTHHRMPMDMKQQFDRASISGAEVCNVLEVGKMPYNHNNSGPKVSSTMISGLPKMGKKSLEFEEENAMESGNLSSTLQKPYMWEKKLLQELKSIHISVIDRGEERKSLYNKGAENHKLEAAHIYIKKLSTKISVAIQVIKSILNKINKLRDEVLWPQTNELIQGYFREAQIDLVKQELQLLDTTTRLAVPEVTDDGVPPFPPRRLGAPYMLSPFVIIGQSALQGYVVHTMQSFASNVLHIWERQRSEWKQGVLAKEDI
ncbi:hypothetical protein EJB05_30686, partial [Eragrostis curvula]